jgi:hypothetical protein
VTINRQLALNQYTAFARLGEPAGYTPAGGSAVAITVIPVAPPDVRDFGETRLRAETDAFAVRVSELPRPAAGDVLLYDGRSLVVKEYHHSDLRKGLWQLETRPA